MAQMYSTRVVGLQNQPKIMSEALKSRILMWYVPIIQLNVELSAIYNVPEVMCKYSGCSLGLYPMKQAGKKNKQWLWMPEYQRLGMFLGRKIQPQIVLQDKYLLLQPVGNVSGVSDCLEQTSKVSLSWTQGTCAVHRQACGAWEGENFPDRQSSSVFKKL